MKIRGKLFSLVIPLGVLVVGILIYFTIMVQSTYSQCDDLFVGQLYDCNSTLINADRDFYQANSAMLQIAAYENLMTAEEKQTWLDDYKENIEQTKERVGQAFIITEEYPELLNFQSDGMTFASEYDSFQKNMDAMLAAYDLEKGTGDNKLYSELFEETRGNISNMEDLMEAYAEESEVNLQKSIQNSILFAIIISVVVSVAVLVFAFISVNRIRFGLVKITDAIKIMANKDLTEEVPVFSGKDEISQLSASAYSLRSQLVNMMETFKNSSEHLSSASDQMAMNTKDSVQNIQSIDAAAGELARTASVQAEDVTNIVSEIQEINNMTEESIDNTSALSNACEDIEKATNSGMEVVEVLTKVTNESNDAFQNIFEAITGIDEKTHTIGRASDMITDIASQTNLLSLNASIEAARAGEAGRGFAVVADEIRQLAEQSAASADTINKMIAELLDSSQNATKQSELVKTYVEEQLKSVNDTKVGFEKIVSNVAIVNGGVDNLRAINGNLGKRVNHMTELVENLSAISEENAATAEELSATTTTVIGSISELESTGDSVNSLSGDLHTVVQEYRVE